MSSHYSFLVAFYHPHINIKIKIIKLSLFYFFVFLIFYKKKDFLKINLVLRMKPLIFSILIFFFLGNLVFALDKNRDCRCRIILKSKIIGGKISDNLFPWQVPIVFKQTSVCTHYLLIQYLYEI
jgi:hypothetical protein